MGWDPGSQWPAPAPDIRADNNTREGEREVSTEKKVITEILDNLCFMHNGIIIN